MNVCLQNLLADSTRRSKWRLGMKLVETRLVVRLVLVLCVFRTNLGFTSYRYTHILLYYLFVVQDGLEDGFAGIFKRKSVSQEISYIPESH